MSAPAAGAGGSPLDRASEWVREHRGAAAGGAGAVAVLGLALHRRHAASTAAGGAGPNTAGSPTGTVGNVQGDPTDTRTEIENFVADQLAQQQAEINAQLAAAKPKPPNTRKPVTPAPRPGSFRYTVSAGDTLAKIAQRLFGEHDARTIAALKHANPILASFGDSASLNYYAGHSIAVPKLTLNPRKPKPKKKPRPKPREPRSGSAGVRKRPQPQPIRRRR